MKNTIIIITTMFLLFFGTSPVQAQDFNPKKYHYLVLSQNIEQLKPILLTANALAEADGKKYGDFYVIICGKTVRDMANNSDFNTFLEDAKNQKVKVFVCGLSLKKFNIDPNLLPSNITVDNGILYGFQLQKKGFLTLTI
ncbi:MAG: sulfur reduction protein DsrE [Flavobacteriales bacterium]